MKKDSVADYWEQEAREIDRRILRWERAIKAARKEAEQLRDAAAKRRRRPPKPI